MNNTEDPLTYNDHINFYGEYVICSLAIVTNILVVITITMSLKSWKYSTGLLLLILACVDVVVNSLRIISTRPIFNIFAAYFIFIMLYGLLAISNYMMVLISLNLFALVCKPFNHHRITSRKSVVFQIIIISIISFTLVPLCWFFLIQYEIVIPFFAGFLLYILPTMISIVFTILVICEFRKNRSTQRESVNTGTLRKGKINITKAIIANNVAFIVLSHPHAILFFLSGHIRMLTVEKYLALLRDINFIINIFIYAAFIPKFRIALFNVFKCKCRNQNSGRRGQHGGKQIQYTRSPHNIEEVRFNIP